MPIAIKMPALSPTMEEGTLARWLVKVGDKVASGDIMAEIETDKATMEFEAVDEGTIVSIDVAEGSEGVKVGTVIATIAGEDEDASAPAPLPPRLLRRRPPKLRRRPPPARPLLPLLRLPPPRAIASSPRRWPSALPPKRASTWPRSRVPAPTAA
jgi:pyruvate dehydrogenase E2 component (dihydrolipoamide acetyltransferase)